MIANLPDDSQVSKFRVIAFFILIKVHIQIIKQLLG